MREIPRETEVIVEAPRFSHVKRRDDGRIDFVSPLPCPFNYGSVPNTVSGDGERIDAVILGPRLARNTRRHWPVVGVVRFIDADVLDPKWICADHPLGLVDRLQVDAFFRVYAVAKRVLNRVRGREGITRYDGLELRSRRDPSG